MSPAASAVAVSTRPRVRVVRVPGHLNNAKLEEVLFGRRPSSAHLDAADDAHAADVPASTAPTPLRYPLNKQLVVLAVRDVGRLCSYMPEHVRALIADDADSELRALAPPVGCVLSEADAAFRALVARLLLRLTGVSLSPSAVSELIAAGQSMAHQSLNMDTRTRRAYLSEPYVAGADNVALSAAVLATSAQFRERQERSWFASGQNPLQQLRLTYPIQALQGLGRMPCPRCSRKSAARSHVDSDTPRAGWLGE